MNLSNDHLHLSPIGTNKKKIIQFNFKGVFIGHGSYREGPTGCSIIYIPNGAMCAVDIRGGSPVLYGTDHGDMRAGSRKIHAICLTGGSMFGLEAVLGVQKELLARNDYHVDWRQMPKVIGAAIYDFLSRDNAIFPDEKLARWVMNQLAENQVEVGNVGAGIAATVGLGKKEGNWDKGGFGAAFYQKGDLKILVLVVVNAIGCLYDRERERIRGYNSLEGGQTDRGGNTTLTVVLTNKRFIPRELKQLSSQIHSSMSRAIYPFHTIDDGDVLFMLSTNEWDDQAISLTDFGMIASEVTWDAILKSVQ